MIRIRFSQTFFATNGSGASVPQFEAGKDYPADDEEAIRCVARGIAEKVDVEETEPAPAEPVAAPAEAAEPVAAPAPAVASKKK